MDNQWKQEHIEGAPLSAIATASVSVQYGTKALKDEPIIVTIAIVNVVAPEGEHGTIVLRVAPALPGEGRNQTFPLRRGRVMQFAGLSTRGFLSSQTIVNGAERQQIACRDTIIRDMSNPCKFNGFALSVTWIEDGPLRAGIGRGAKPCGKPWLNRLACKSDKHPAPLRFAKL